MNNATTISPRGHYSLRWGVSVSLEKNEFKVLIALMDENLYTQRALAEATGLSLGSVNRLCQVLRERGLMDGFYLTAEGYEALAPYKVENAIIMAAGLSSRFAPLSYEKPKGVLTVRGEVLIERQIRQLLEAGIDDITLVVGYMKEAFFYLEDAMGVKILVNEEYATRNNNSTLMLVREQLGNTYICSSDDYFTENVFEPYVYEAYYAGMFFEGPTDEYCMRTGRDDRIVGVTVGGSDSYGMLGHAYFDHAFSQTFSELLEREYRLPDTAPKLWEDIYRDHLKELRMVLRPYEAGVIYEFDSLSDLKQFDQDFLMNVDSKILDNICRTLRCERSEIEGVVPIKEGLTNLSFKFSIGETSYVYRHPGLGTSEIINRASEAYSQTIAKKLGIDETFVYQDPIAGWKLSHYMEDCVPFDYHNWGQVTRALSLIKKLHESGETSEWEFGVYDKAQELVGLLSKRSYPSFPDFDEINEKASQLNDLVGRDNVAYCLCHNDFYSPNFLVKGDEMSLIDWEYSAMSDYASDLGTFICCSDYDFEDAERVIATYFGRKPTRDERRHCLAYVALAAYYWFVWALYKESAGDPVGEWLYLWYRSVRAYSAKALPLYDAHSN
jgi:CTP:phosphocholine cytidylyltransferase-like protein/thiamine kinase-like enzyme